MAEQISHQGRRREDAHLRQLETTLRRFVERTRDVPTALFPVSVEDLLNEARPLLAQLDSARDRNTRLRSRPGATKLP